MDVSTVIASDVAAGDGRTPMIAAFVDPRARMRAALRTLVDADPDQWHAPSLQIFRNRLLDVTGSDARPLADLLIEALHRGWHDALPRTPLETSRWDALAAPFVMRWSAERFIQPDMAQWAAESWAFAFGTITPEQLRIAPPTATPAQGSDGSRRTAAAAAHATAVATPNAAVRGAPNAAVARVSSAARPGRPTTASTRTRVNAKGRYTPTGASGLPMPNPRLVRNVAIAAGLSYVGLFARIAWDVRQNKVAARAAAGAPAVASGGTQATPDAATAPQAAPNAATAPAGRLAPSTAVPNGQAALTTSPQPTQVAGAAARVGRAPLAMPQEYTTVTTAPESFAGASANGAGAANAAASGAGGAGGASPGVPSLTRGLLETTIGDRSRMVYREPAQRASGNAVPLSGSVAVAPPSLVYDEVFLNDGTSMRGRVEIMHAGSVQFRDQRTGLRHELRKDDIDRIITEFGAPVRFRAERRGVTDAAKRTQVSLSVRPDSGVRARGVSGTYDIRYGATTATGSPECTTLWSRPRTSGDRAVVRHVPGADTLTVYFDGGDNFPSNMDSDGYFASTFRIVRDQARTSTALTTRLTGQFQPDGNLALQVSIVFFRRMREGPDLTCSVNINAVGTNTRSRSANPK